MAGEGVRRQGKGMGMHQPVGADEAATWTTPIGGEPVRIPATIDGVREALGGDPQRLAEFEAEIGAAPADRLHLVVARWSLSTTAADEEDDAVVARLRVGDFTGCVPQAPDAGAA